MRARGRPQAEGGVCTWAGPGRAGKRLIGLRGRGVQGLGRQASPEDQQVVQFGW